MSRKEPAPVLISVKKAAELLNMAASTIKKRGHGTQNLKHLRVGGGTKISLRLDEVEALILEADRAAAEELERIKAA